MRELTATLNSADMIYCIDSSPILHCEFVIVFHRAAGHTCSIQYSLHVLHVCVTELSSSP